MKRDLILYIALMSAVVFSLTGFPVHASDVPAVVNYSGQLTDNDGVSFSNGYYHVVFRIWDHPSHNGAGNLVWGRVFPLHIMDNGLFNILMTDDGGEISTPGNPLEEDLREAFNQSERYLGLTVVQTPKGAVSGAEEMLPRQRLTCAPYALHAQHADEALTAVDADLATRSDETNDSISSTAGFNVAESLYVGGTTTLNNNLTVTGDMAAHSTMLVYGDVTITDPDHAFQCNDLFPVGSVLMWSGAKHTIPDDWALCDGNTYNGRITPDLRDRFVAGAGTAFANKSTGGENNVTLTVAQMPAHTHDFYSYQHWNGGWALSSHNDSNKMWKSGSGTMHTSEEGNDEAHENRPRFYALCFIMRIK